ncbi:MAG: hypothetical protein GY832_00840 [Chloroflexi bacterium]|nr:hypothetical protein [Chloroflexota bacterium]
MTEELNWGLLSTARTAIPGIEKTPNCSCDFPITQDVLHGAIAATKRELLGLH